MCMPTSTTTLESKGGTMWWHRGATAPPIFLFIYIYIYIYIFIYLYIYIFLKLYLYIIYIKFILWKIIIKEKIKKINGDIDL